MLIFQSELCDRMSVGERIIEFRKAQNITQGKLAEALGVSRQAVSKWENDQSTPDPAKMIQLADILDTDIEYLSTGRRNYGRRPPVVINTVETIETVVEKPVVQVVEKVVEKIVEKPVVTYVEKPVVKKVYRKQLVRNPLEFLVCGGACFLLGLLLGFFL